MMMYNCFKVLQKQITHKKLVTKIIQGSYKTNSDLCNRNMGAEENIIQKLLIFGRKILRRIFGPTKENKIWRIKAMKNWTN